MANANLSTLWRAARDAGSDAPRKETKQALVTYMQRSAAIRDYALARAAGVLRAMQQAGAILYGKWSTVLGGSSHPSIDRRRPGQSGCGVSDLPELSSRSALWKSPRNTERASTGLIAAKERIIADQAHK